MDMTFETPFVLCSLYQRQTDRERETDRQTDTDMGGGGRSL